MNNRGFLHVIVLIIIGFLILAYFRIDLRDILESETATNNWEYAKEMFEAATEKIKGLIAKLSA